MLKGRTWAIFTICLGALTAVSCKEADEAKEKQGALKSAIAFYRTIEDSPTPELENIQDLKGYRLYGYPALVYESLQVISDVTKLESGGYEVALSLWCDGVSAAGEKRKLRRTLLVRLMADPAAPNGWTVARFKFREDGELTLARQFFTWLLWMFISPMAFYLLLLLMAGGFLWPRVALYVAYLMGLPLRIYVSMLWFGSVWATVIGMVAWTVFEGAALSQKDKS